MPRKRFWPVTAALTVAAAAATALVILFLGRALMAPPPAERSALQPESEGLAVLWEAPSIRMVNQLGAATTNSDLFGRPWIASFFFTTCTTVCPKITATTVALQRQLPDAELRFVSFSVDPEHDSVEVLEQYSKRWGGDPRWLLLRPEPGNVQALAAGMRVIVEASDDPVNPIVHTSMFFLVDQHGKVRGVYDSNDDAALDRLVRHTRELLGAAGPPAAGDAQGAELYARLGCGACHDDARLAPSFAGLLGSERRLTDGTHVTVDRTYVRESIITPGAKIAQGYVALMPSYRAHLDDQQLEALVSHVAALGAREAPAPGAAPQADAELVIDPVCHMQVRVTPDTPHATHAGRDYHFCAESCRKRFVAAPEQFTNGKP